MKQQKKVSIHLLAAALAVWLHGYAGDLAKEELGEFGMLPRDMIERIPRAICSLQKHLLI